jgi:hypothetical protein
VLIADASYGSFVAEGEPIPMRSLAVGTPVTMEPRTIKTGWSLTREMIESSNAEALTIDAMKRSVGLTLDKHLFDDVAGDTIRPAGLRYGVPASSASTSPDLYEAMLQDVATLLGAVAATGGPVTLIASETRAAMMAARARSGTLPVVLGSPMVAADMLIAVATDGLAVAFDAAPEVGASRSALIHQSDTPAPIVDGGTMAGPTRSLFQTDSTGFRIGLSAVWAKRHASAVAWMTTTW